MKESRFLIISFVAIFLTCLLIKTAFAVTWEKTYGGSDIDVGYSVQQTQDGGYIIAGKTESFDAAGSDVYIVKCDAVGNEIWHKTFGVGNYDDVGYSVQQTQDGGYIIAGYTELYSTNNDDLLLIKTDADGNEIWHKTFGGGYSDQARSVQQTQDGGYILVGHMGAFSGQDIYLIKTDANGNEVWHKTFGGSGTEYGMSVQQTTDGGYIIAGQTESFGAGMKDVYLIKTDADGNMDWSKTFGGSDSDVGQSAQQSEDGGYIIVGYTWSSGEGQQDIYLIKTDADGNMDWSKTFGGTNFDWGEDVQQTEDGGYIISGSKQLSLGGPYDFYLIKTNAFGDMVWSKSFRENASANGYSVQQTTDRGYITTGRTISLPSGDSDVYLIYYKPELPLKASNPTPSNGSTNTSTNTDISWSDGGGATSYDAYFGTDPAPDSGAFKGNQVSTTYDPGRLELDTTYYWRIDAKNECGATTGDVWSFTTQSAQAMPWVPLLLLDD